MQHSAIEGSELKAFEEGQSVSFMVEKVRGVVRTLRRWRWNNWKVGHPHPQQPSYLFIWNNLVHITFIDLQLPSKLLSLLSSLDH